ncbi:MAG: YigZ family protein [Clostridia bacterium]|nr:YigZ family protein [Clostridia bacterium]
MNSIIEEKSCKNIVLKSKFLSFVFSCEDLKKQNERLKYIRKEHFSASHICFASVFENEQHMSDDSEPSGTAGAMIMSELKEFDVINTLCVVVRYFGGVKLGASRLGKVYKNCAKMCLVDNVKCVEKKTLYSGSCSYNSFDLIQKYFQKTNVKLKSVKFENTVFFEVFLSKIDKDIIEKITILQEKSAYIIN